MGFNFLMALTSPITWLLLAGIVSVMRRNNAKHKERHTHNAAQGDRPAFGRRRLGIARGAALDVGAAFLFLSTAYRPSHAFLMKAQIQQREDVDEDDQGGPESPLRHLHRQLRRIRRGEHVERLIWRIE